jgi:uncharacterized membrane protein YdjX (TVP38/TMEM64 family)
VVTEYLVLFSIVFAVNLLPAFGPPTWSIIVLYGFNSDLPVVGTVGTAAASAASGRYILALSFRALGDRVPERIRRNLAAAKKAFEQRKRAGFVALGLFAVSPLPSAQLFEAAGLSRVKLFPFTLAFFSGRLVSYSIYVGTAHSIKSVTAGKAFTAQLTSPWGIAVQLLMIAALVAFARTDWERVLRKGPDK